MQRYMKSDMPYRGVTTPVLRELCSSIFPHYPMATFEEWQRTIIALWDRAEYREERYAALALVGDRHYAPFRTLEALGLYQRLIVGGAWWDLVDGLATHEVGALLRGYPEVMREQLLTWSRGADPWLRRTSIICQVGFKRMTDQQLLYACIEPNLADKDFFMRKAIGWALRQYAWTDAQEVSRYVAANRDRLSPLSVREALKNVGRSRWAALLASRMHGV